MNPPQVLIERSAIAALCDPTSRYHERLVAEYLTLVDAFERDQLLLVAVSDHLRAHRSQYEFSRRGPLAPVDTLHIGHQHRRAARRMAVTDFDAALTLVMCERHKVARMLTLDPQFTTYDLDVHLLSDDDDLRI